MNNILIPRNLDSRIEKQKQIDYQRIQEYIKNGSKGILDLDGTPLTKLPDNLTKIGGSLTIYNSSIEDLNNLEVIKGSLYADNSKLKSLPPKLTRIEYGLSVPKCPIDNINDLGYIGGNLYMDNTNISELPEGLRVGGFLYCRNTPLSKRFSDESSLGEYLKERHITVKKGISF